MRGPGAGESIRMLALLGGDKIFPQGIRFVHPKPPALARLRGWLDPMLESGRLTNLGPNVQAFEQAIARAAGTAECVTVANATLGLILVPWAWGLQGEVIAPSFTFSASIHALVWAHLTPVLVDVDSRTLTIDPRAVEAAITPRTSAILAVCVFGIPPHLDALEAIARRHKLRLLCDTAQGFGSRYHGRPLGGFGDAEVFSFHAAKVLPTGEGGAVVTNDRLLARRIRLATNFGNPGSGDCEVIGLNAKMTEWSAILGLAGLETFEADLAQRRALWDAYASRLSRLPGVRIPELPDAHCQGNGQNFSLVIDEAQFGLSRDELQRVLEAEGVECKRYFDPPIHRMRAYQGASVRMGPLEVTERVARSTLSLPLHLYVGLDDVAALCDTIEAARQQQEAIRRRLGKETTQA